MNKLECRLECSANQIMGKAAQLSILGETEMLKVLLFIPEAYFRVDMNCNAGRDRDAN